MALDKDQLSALKHRDGPAMVLAGPGSGKTTVITGRVYNLITELKVEAKKILVITFTKKATIEMRDRFLKRIKSDNTQVTYTTFHAIFFSILKKNSTYNSSNIINENEKIAFLRSEIRYLDLEIRDEYELSCSIISDISSFKARYASSENNSNQANFKNSSGLSFKDFIRIYNDYETMLESTRRIDFDDMMTKTLKLLKENPDILAFYQNYYSYVLIDEFQDTSPIQLEIIILLFKKKPNIFVVGDDDQSIYGFRGASVTVMQDFLEVFKDAKIYKITKNYRSDYEIVDKSSNLISSNSSRFNKELKCQSQNPGIIKILGFDTMEEEADFITKLSQSGKTCLLARTNYICKELSLLLKNKGFLCHVSERKKPLCQSIFALDMMAYLKLAYKGFDRTNLLRILNKPERFLNRLYLSRELKDFNQISALIKEEKSLLEWNKLLESLSLIAGLSPYAALTYIYKVIGYQTYLASLYGPKINEYKKACDSCEQIIEISKNCLDYADLELALKEYDDKTLDNDFFKAKKGHNISVLTMHASKGLEFVTVFIADCNVGVIPYRDKNEVKCIDEERRLFYVAMTRAKHNLYIMYIREKHGKRQRPSRFLKEINAN